jgi:AcrR family transcriptional regulator
VSYYFGEGKKGALLQSAIELFAARGYDAVSVRDIAKAAGVSEAAMYKHFKGKEDMALFLFREIVRDYAGRVLIIREQHIPTVEKLCQIVNITYDLFQMRPAEVRFALLSQYNFWDLVEEEVKPHFHIRAILEDGMQRGEIPRQEVYFWIAVYTGVMLQPLAQYQYFADVLPELPILKEKVCAMVRKLVSH